MDGALLMCFTNGPQDEGNLQKEGITNDQKHYL